MRNSLSIDRLTRLTITGVLSAAMALGLLSGGVSAADARPTPPATEKRPVSDTYHGTEVVEDYRWLEDSNDAAVKTWSDAQNAYARSVLDKLPGREAIERRVSEIMSAELVSYWGVVYHGGKAINSSSAK